jgi:hypothetical protein
MNVSVHAELSTSMVSNGRNSLDAKSTETGKDKWDPWVNDKFLCFD